MTLRRLVIAAACALLLAWLPGIASAAQPKLSSLQAQDLALSAKGVRDVVAKNPLGQWSCIYANDSAFWNCAYNAASDGQSLAIVKIFDPQKRVWSVTIPRTTAPAQRYDEKRATAIAAKDPKAADWIARYRDHGRPVHSYAALNLGTWQVKWYSGDAEIAEVGVLDTTGAITYSRTGPQVAWSMARGGQGFGRLINEPWALGTLLVLIASVS